MKKAIWIIAVLALAMTACALAFLPETVPVHFDAYWNPDRWGSKFELLLLPGILLLLSVFWTALLNAQEKKAAEAEEEKIRVSALTNRKSMGIAGISLAAVLTLVEAWLLVVVFRAASGAETSGAALDRLPFILVGLLFIVLGNIMPKTRRNGVIGFRNAWSMFNDDTWRRVNRFGGYAMVAAGVLTVITCALIPNVLGSVIAILALTTAAIAVTMGYARRVYAEEKQRSEKGEN